MILSIGSWSEAEIAFEHLGQMTLTCESTLERDMNQRQIPLFEQMLRSLDPLTQYKLVRAFSCRLAEQASKVIGAKASLFRQRIKREVLAEMVLNEISHPSYLLRRQFLR